MNPQERRNILKCTVGEALFGLGMGLVAIATALPLLLEHLGAGKVMIGLAFSIGTAGWYVGQPLGLLTIARKRRTKRFLVPWSFTFAVPTYAAMGAAVWFLADSRPMAAAWAVLALLAVRIVGAGAGVPLWFDWQSRIFRREIRGRAIGAIAGASALGVTVAAVAAGVARRTITWPLDYTLLFAFSSLSCAVALCFLLTVREPAAVTQPTPRLGLRAILRRFRRSLGERNFRSYLIARILLTLGAGAVAFYAVHFKSPEGGGLESSTVIALGACLTLPLRP